MTGKLDPDDVRGWFESKYIGAWDVLEDKTMTISKVERGVVEGEKGRKDKAPLVWFRTSKKPLVCNKTNLKTIASIVGSNKAKDWIGKRITLYATECAAKGGGMVPCVRVRPTAPGGGRDAEGVGEAPVDQDMRAAQMAAAGRPTVDEIERMSGIERGEAMRRAYPSTPREPGSDDV